MMRRIAAWFRLRRLRREFRRRDDFVFLNEDVILPGAGEPREMGEITGVFHTVGEEIRLATETARQAKEAASRITATIGAPPSVLKKT